MKLESYLAACMDCGENTVKKLSMCLGWLVILVGVLQLIAQSMLVYRLVCIMIKFEQDESVLSTVKTVNMCLSANQPSEYVAVDTVDECLCIANLCMLEC